MRRVLLVVAAVVLASCGSTSAVGPSAKSAAGQFVDRYVAASGRVVRRDQGGDTVSEGQAYGMLLAEVAGRDAVVRRIWAWTKDHLRRDDGLLAWHTDASGHVVDWSAAGDADTLAAFALLRYDGSGAAGLHADGRSLARAVLDHESTTTPAGLVTVAGDWAKGPPAVVDPSYWAPWVARTLASRTGDRRWSQVADATSRLLRGTSLPPDWAVVSGAALTPTGVGGGSGGAQYGADAQRLPIFLAAGGASDRRLAAAWWAHLERASGAGVLGLDGSVRDPNATPTSLMAAASAARAARDATAARRLTQRAVAAARSGPTYFGDACVALGLALAQGELR